MGCMSTKPANSKGNRLARWRSTGIVGLRDSKLKAFPDEILELDRAIRTLDLTHNRIGKLNHDAGKKKILHLRGKEKEISRVSDSLILNEISASPVENANLSTASKRNQRHDTSGRIIRSLLLKDKSSSSAQPEQQVQILSSEKGKRPPRPVNVKSIAFIPLQVTSLQALPLQLWKGLEMKNSLEMIHME